MDSDGNGESGSHAESWIHGVMRPGRLRVLNLCGVMKSGYGMESCGLGVKWSQGFRESCSHGLRWEWGVRDSCGIVYSLSQDAGTRRVLDSCGVKLWFVYV
jgi:hypothetical protein